MAALKRTPIFVSDGTVLVPLTRGLWSVVDPDDVILIAYQIWQAKERSDGNGFYAIGASDRVKMHRRITGTSPGVLVSHRDGDGLNNRRSNLREASSQQNAQCRSPMATGLPPGVREINGRYYARINSHGRPVALGGYATAEEARDAYVREAAARYGEWLHPSLRFTMRKHP